MPHLVVDSAERIKGTVENYTVRVFTPLKDVQSIRLIGAQIPKTFHHIVDGWNNEIEFTSGSIGLVVITIPSGSYTGISLAAAITTEMNAAYGATTVIVKYVAATNKFTVRFAPPEIAITFSFAGGTSIDKRVAHTYGLFDPIDHFTGSPTYSTVGVDHELPNQVDMSYPRQLYLNVGLAQWQGQDVWTDRNSHSFYLPMTGTNFGEIENWTAQSFYHQVTQPSNVNAQEIRIEWRASDPDYPLTFGGVNHQLLFEVITV